VNDQEPIDAEVRSLAVVESAPESQSNLALFSGEPEEVIARAVKVADALKAVIQSKGLVKKIKDREFVEIAGWQTLATMVGVTSFCEWSRPIENGWEARVVVRRNGFDIGAAEAQCTRAESLWRNRDDFAIRSMAQTRAASKALRSVLGFVVVLAGYEDTPASEVPDQGFSDAPPDPAEIRRRNLAKIHIYAKKNGIEPAVYDEILRSKFEVFNDPQVLVTAAALNHQQLVLFYSLLKAHVAERGGE